MAGELTEQLQRVRGRIDRAYGSRRDRKAKIKTEQAMDEIDILPAERKQSLTDWFLDPERTDPEIREQVQAICNSPPFSTDP